MNLQPINVCIKVEKGMIATIKTDHNHWDLDLNIVIYDLDGEDGKVIKKHWSKDTKKLKKYY